METVAIRIAENCDENHSGSNTVILDQTVTSFTLPSPPISLGENLAFSDNDPPVFDNGATGAINLVDLWISEGEYYTYGTYMGTDSCTAQNVLNTNGCGHFTQVQLNHDNLCYNINTFTLFI